MSCSPIGLSDGIIKPLCAQDFVGVRVSSRDEPLATSHRVVPPFTLLTIGVLSEVQVFGQHFVVGVGFGTAQDLATKAEVVDIARPAVGAVQEEGHS